MNKVDCRKCDNFQDDYPIKVIDYVSNSSFFADEISHWEEGYHCTWNGITGGRIEDLQKGKCRCRGDD